MLRPFKAIDLGLQLVLYALLLYMILATAVFEQRALDAAIFGSLVTTMAPIGIWHGLSSLVHAFLPKSWQLLPHRKRYGWLVIGYFVLMPLAFVLGDGMPQYRSFVIAVFISAVPLGFYYCWITWREWRQLRDVP